MRDNIRILKKIEKMVKSFAIPLEVELDRLHANQFQTLISIILSARTKDTTTASVLEQLFVIVKSPKDLIVLSTSKIEKLIYPVGFYKNKAKNLKKLALQLNDQKIPKVKTKLLELSGVGPKTANLYLSRVLNENYICVDIHVHRISNRVFLKEKTDTPAKTEKVLEKLFPKQYWQVINSDLVKFGQNICLPRNPKCTLCEISNNCLYYKNK